MFYGFLLVIHILACLSLIIIVLIQAGRGGGLSESFSGADSIFGAKTSSFLSRATTVFAVIFFVTCLSLAFISKQRSRSLLEGKVSSGEKKDLPGAAGVLPGEPVKKDADTSKLEHPANEPVKQEPSNSQNAAPDSRQPASP